MHILSHPQLFPTPTTASHTHTSSHTIIPFSTPLLPSPSHPPTQIEDILKRSFAEFYSQRATPELVHAVHAGSDVLARLQAAAWPVSHVGSTREEVGRLYRLTQELREAQTSAVKQEVCVWVEESVCVE